MHNWIARRVQHKTKNKVRMLNCDKRFEKRNDSLAFLKSFGGSVQSDVQSDPELSRFKYEVQLDDNSFVFSSSPVEGSVKRSTCLPAFTNRNLDNRQCLR